MREGEGEGGAGRLEREGGREGGMMEGFNGTKW